MRYQLRLLTALVLLGASTAHAAITQPAIGTGAHANGQASITATLPSHSTGDLLVCVAYVEAPTTLSTAASGWGTLGYIDAAYDLLVIGKIAASGAESSPQFDITGNAAGESDSAICFTFRGTHQTFGSLLDVAVVTQTNTSAQDIAHPAISGIATDGVAILAIAGKVADWTSVATLTTGAAGWAEITEEHSTTGGGNGIVADWYAQSTAGNVGTGSWVVTGGSAAVSHAIMLAIKPAAVAPTFSVAPTVTAQDSNDYTLSYTPSASATFYAVACKKDQAAPTVAQVKAGNCTGDVAAVASANEAVTGADTTVLGGSLTFPVHDLYAVLNNAGGDSSLQTLADECLDAPSGKQIINCPNGLTSIGSGSAVAAMNAIVTPDIAVGDIPIIDLATTPEACLVEMTLAGYINISGPTPETSCSSARQYVNATFYDLSAGGIHADDLDWWLNNLPPIPPEPGLTLFVPLNSAMTPYDFTDSCPDPEGDAVTVTNVDSLPANLSVIANVLQGTATVRAKTTDITFRCTDITGASVDWD